MAWLPGIRSSDPFSAVSGPRANQALTSSGLANDQYRKSWCHPVRLEYFGCLVITQLWWASGSTRSVSYTHLTLPTKA